MDNTINAYGWQDRHSLQFEHYKQQGLVPSRIVWEGGKGYYRGVSDAGTYLLQCSGTLLNLHDLGVRPAVVIGDWCAIRPYAQSRALIEDVLPRSNEFHRPSVHDGPCIEGSGQAVAANIDLAAIVQDCSTDFNLRRIERFMALLHADTIPMVVILTKASLLDEPEAYRRRTLARFPDCPVYIIDSLARQGLDELKELCKPRETIMLLGTSGAGKSTLINALCQEDVAKTAAVRTQDGRGRHTTTARCLYRLPTGALLLDSPGIRAVGMNNGTEEVGQSFCDIAELASHCKFSNCKHTGEPGCAVRQALIDGELEQDRYFNYLQLNQEARSWEEILNQRKQKEKSIGRLQYQLRRNNHD